jgi:hypothetical protein
VNLIAGLKVTLGELVINRLRIEDALDFEEVLLEPIEINARDVQA